MILWFFPVLLLTKQQIFTSLVEWSKSKSRILLSPDRIMILWSGGIWAAWTNVTNFSSISSSISDLSFKQQCFAFKNNIFPYPNFSFCFFINCSIRSKACIYQPYFVKSSQNLNVLSYLDFSIHHIHFGLMKHVLWCSWRNVCHKLKTYL